MGMPFRRFPSFPVALITVAALLVPAAALGDPPPPGRGAPSGSAPASRATPSGPASAPTQDAAPATIPVPEVARRADEVAKLIRELDALLVPGPIIDAIKKQLPDSAARIKVLTDDSITQLDGEPSAATLDRAVADDPRRPVGARQRARPACYRHRGGAAAADEAP